MDTKLTRAQRITSKTGLWAIKKPDGEALLIPYSVTDAPLTALVFTSLGNVRAYIRFHALANKWPRKHIGRPFPINDLSTLARLDLNGTYFVTFDHMPGSHAPHPRHLISRYLAAREGKTHGEALDRLYSRN